VTTLGDRKNTRSCPTKGRGVLEERDQSKKSTKGGGPLETELTAPGAKWKEGGVQIFKRSKHFFGTTKKKEITKKKAMGDPCKKKANTKDSREKGTESPNGERGCDRPRMSQKNQKRRKTSKPGDSDRKGLRD